MRLSKVGLVGAFVAATACSSGGATPADGGAPSEGGNARSHDGSIHSHEGSADAPAVHGTATPHEDGGTSPGRDAGSSTGDSGGQPPDAAHCASCRNWTDYPAVAQFDGVTELWAMSDIHADYNAATKLLTAAHLLTAIPASPGAAQWGGGSATLVIVGDMLDKGPFAPALLTFVSALQASAAAGQGRVVVTMGNHEAEFLANPENSSATGTAGVDTQLLEAGVGIDATAGGTDPFGIFLRTLPIAARVDDWFFVHAGDTGGVTLSALESSIENGVDSDGYATEVLLGDDSMLEARLSGSPPQWWDTTGDATTLLTTWTAALGAKHLVMGHQPGAVGIKNGPNRNKDQMASEYGGLLFLIDTGMSVDVDDTGGALLHVTNVGTASEAWEEVLATGATMGL